MRIRGTVSVISAAYGVLLATGCGAAGDAQGEAPAGVEGAETAEAEDDVGETSSAIRFGVEGGSSGAVELGVGCTGFLVGAHMIVTASHCFDGALGNPSSGPAAPEGIISTAVNYAHTGTSWSCMTGTPSNGKCAPRNVFVRRLTMARPEHDLAVVFTEAMGGTWQNTGRAADGLYDGAFSVNQNYTHFGAGFFHWDGTGAGVMRFMTDTVDGVSTNHFTTNAADTRVCRGDSGGPYYLSGNGFWAFGIQSKAVLSNECAKVGGRVLATRLNSSKVAQINAWRGAEGLPACTQHSLSFPNFWVCQ